MNNYNKIKELSIDDMARFLCDNIALAVDCDECPAAKHCCYGHNGVKHWLEQESNT